MIFERKKYLDELIAGRGNGLVKIITGVRRCGKSFLLFVLWHNWLLEHGATDSHIIEIQLDDFRNRRLRKPDALLDYIDSKGSGGWQSLLYSLGRGTVGRRICGSYS